MKNLTIYRHLAIVVIFTLSLLPVCSQERKVMNKPYIDQRQFHYGFLVGLHLQDLEFENNGYIDENGNQWFADVLDYDPGFSVGILGEFKLHKHFAFRVIPSMHFGNKTATFKNAKNGERQMQQIKSTYISVPLDIKFSAERFNNYRPYIMAGVSPALDLTVKKGKNLLLNKFDCFLEVGAGCDFYLPFFKFIPEVKFCYGLTNILNLKRTDLTDKAMQNFSKSVNNATSKMIVFTFYFE